MMLFLQIYCYNTTSDEIYSYYNTTRSMYSPGGGSFWINTTFYYYAWSGEIQSFDFSDNTQTLIVDTSFGGSDCMASSNPPSDDFVYFVTATDDADNELRISGVSRVIFSNQKQQHS